MQSAGSDLGDFVAFADERFERLRGNRGQRVFCAALGQLSPDATAGLSTNASARLALAGNAS